MKRFVVSPGAAQDLNDIWEHIAQDNLDAADRFLGKLHDQILTLAETPRMGHRRDDLAKDRPILFWPVGNYLILYRATKGFVEVVAVAHGKRDIPALTVRKRLKRTPAISGGQGPG
jgi:plasmid stabilization system protein ParE